jgi:hypothetical protein
VARRLAEEEDPMEVFRLQGRAQQLRLLEALPAEINGLLADYDEQDRRADELREAKEKRNAEVR